MGGIDLMMPDFHNTRSFVKHYQHEQRRIADQFRLAMIASDDHSRIRFYYPLLERLGRWLIVQGTHLQTRYGKFKEVASASIDPGHSVASLHTR